MSELGERRAIAVVASGLGWNVGKTATGFNVEIERANGSGYFSTDVAQPATDTEREAAKDRLLDSTSHDEATAAIEVDRIAAAFAAPWVQA